MPRVSSSWIVLTGAVSVFLTTNRVIIVSRGKNKIPQLAGEFFFSAFELFHECLSCTDALSAALFKLDQDK